MCIPFLTVLVIINIQNITYRLDKSLNICLSAIKTENIYSLRNQGVANSQQIYVFNPFDIPERLVEKISTISNFGSDHQLDEELNCCHQTENIQTKELVN